jgi:nitrogen-specific signal transduction histidine kinase
MSDTSRSRFSRPSPGRHAGGAVDPVSTLVHDIRSPLTVIRCLAQLLTDFDNSPDEQLEYARSIIAQTARMSDILANVVANAGLDDGMLDLAEVVKEVERRVEARPRSRFVATVPSGSLIVADRAALVEATWLLVDHVLRHLADGVEVTMRSDGATALCVRPDRPAAAGPVGFAVTAAAAMIESVGGNLVVEDGVCFVLVLSQPADGSAGIGSASSFDSPLAMS